MTTQEKITMHEQITKHGNNLLAIFPNATEQDPYHLCSKLRRYEAQATKLTEDYCNTGKEHGNQLNSIRAYVLRLLKATPEQAEHIFINQDPRGYALKIKDEYTRAHDLKIHRDWGGYGILAPDYTPNN